MQDPTPNTAVTWPLTFPFTKDSVLTEAISWEQVAVRRWDKKQGHSASKTEIRRKTTSCDNTSRFLVQGPDPKPIGVDRNLSANFSELWISPMTSF